VFRGRIHAGYRFRIDLQQPRIRGLQGEYYRGGRAEFRQIHGAGIELVYYIRNLFKRYAALLDSGVEHNAAGVSGEYSHAHSLKALQVASGYGG